MTAAQGSRWWRKESTGPDPSPTAVRGSLWHSWAAASRRARAAARAALAYASCGARGSRVTTGRSNGPGIAPSPSAERPSVTTRTRSSLLWV